MDKSKKKELEKMKRELKGTEIPKITVIARAMDRLSDGRLYYIRERTASGEWVILDPPVPCDELELNKKDWK